MEGANKQIRVDLLKEMERKMNERSLSLEQSVDKRSQENKEVVEDQFKSENSASKRNQ